MTKYIESVASQGCIYQPQMFPSNTNPGVLHAYDEQYLFSDANPSKHDLPSTFFHFSPTIDHVNDFLHDHDMLSGPFSNPLLMANEITSEISNKALDKDMVVLGTQQNLIPNNTNISDRKKGMKKDRHSKILTAHGPRDRRMRLSLEIARKFFDLQDMLGYEKASKTVDWLLNKSKGAIKKLASGFSQTSVGAKSVSSTSDCEVISGVDETIDNESKENSVSANQKGKKIRQTRKATFHKESRAMKRAKARERTREKMWGKQFDESKQWHETNPNQLSSLSPLETGEDSVSPHSSHNKKSCMEFLAPPSSLPLEHPGSIDGQAFDCHQHVVIPQGVNSEDLVSLHTNGLINIFPENWVNYEQVPSSFFKNSSDARPGSQSMDAQFCYNPWEAYNNRSL
ncbi:uncharacterized protein LOC143876759 [Tasmannia lanceolata]|uniref:uncharacterized protein LOC143876759 n=1 Tax=Tasmannia lanceolata TaxID=3420 RepID=UPI0040646858